MKITEEQTLWEKLQSARKPILLFGMGNGADKIISALKEYGVSISGVFSSDEHYKNKVYNGFKLLTYSKAKELFGDMIVLMAFGSNRNEVFACAKAIAKEQEFYVPDVPVYGGGLFDRKFFEKHKKEMEKVYSLLEDGQSKSAYEAVINYKLTGKAEYLFGCESSNNEAFKSILAINEREDFLDLGAYNGDTINELLAYTDGQYTRITALEPDGRNFKKLESATKNLPAVTLYNKAVSNSVGTTSFSNTAGRNASVSKIGGATVNTTTIDALQHPFTYIKMDVEGNEQKALQGGQNTLRRFKPKLLIAAYHRNEDIFSLALEVVKINPAYKIYFRHYPYLPAWDTNFYFI